MFKTLRGMLGVFLNGVVFTTVVVGALASFRYYESEHMPVVPRFDVMHTDWSGDVLTIWGIMNKVRPCGFDSMLAYYVTKDGMPNRANVRYPDEKASRPPILQKFGPIWIDIPGDYKPESDITLWANHKCFPLWLSSSKLSVFSPFIEPLPVLPDP